MPQDPEETTQDVEEIVECEKGDHLSDLDETARRFLSTFSTIRSKIDDLARAESDIKRFELSIEADRKRLQKTLEGAKLALKNSRIQMAAELSKLDAAGFSAAAEAIKAVNGA